ncbi:ester cyclase [Streptomyces sp. HUCO-GS316]|uniref:ester cyclase n=1 Tax=Streptomyces sp. HUCO-GS316 TaxID=2692198 RepID=UPI00136C99EC|nr:ester cyclase [Streptomyces sp. HUCO-GS316]MXM68578.1 ester cyclase [Streptomyces sp. HUCO-GS316]
MTAAAQGGRSSVQEANKALARRWFDEGWSRGELEVADEIFAPRFLLGGKPVGPGGPKESVRLRRTAFSGLTVQVGLQVAEGPWVASWYTTRGTHVGEFAGVAPTGRAISSEGIQLWRVENGLVVEDRNVFDVQRVLGQLRAPEGKIPGPAPFATDLRR